MPATDTDVLLVDVPADFRMPESTWCLGYRYMIAALRRHGFRARILHPPIAIPGKAARARLIEEIVRASASIVGFTTYDVKLAPLLELIADLRAAGLSAHVTLGGLCASVVAREILEQYPAVDSVVTGEGEQSIVDLARNICSPDNTPPPGITLRRGLRVVAGPARPHLLDLTTLAPPCLDNFMLPGESASLRLVYGAVPVTASRGCYGRCSFCCIHEFYDVGGTSWRAIAPARVVDDIEHSVAATASSRITFVDENFMGPKLAGRSHAVEIAREIQRRGIIVEFNFGCRANDVDRATIEELRRAGLAAISIGIESMSPDTLRLFRKGTTRETNYAALALLERLGISTEITFIFFHPLLRLCEIPSNLRFIDFVHRSRHLYFNNHSPFTEFVPFFGTELCARLVREGLATRRIDGYELRYADPAVAFVASAVQSIPAERILDLRNLLPERYSPVITRMRAVLYELYVDLNMRRVPNLVAQLCKRFELGDTATSNAVQAVMTEFAVERDRIDSLTEDVLAHAA